MAAALHARWPNAGFTVAGMPLAQLSAGRRPLTDGAVVVVQAAAGPAEGAAAPAAQGTGAQGTGAAGAAGAPRPVAPAVLAVCSGPGAGAMFALHRGTYSLGRGRCRISIADPGLSRHHGTLTVGERSMTLAAAPGSTGFSILRAWRDDPLAAAVPLRGSAAIEAGDLIRCGLSGLVIGLAAPWGAADASGMLDAAVLAPEKLPGSALPRRNRWGPLAAGLAPLAVGVLLAWLTGAWMFLAFAAMGVVAVLPPLLGGARARRAALAAAEAAAVRDALRRRSAFPGADALVATALGTGLRSRGEQDPGPAGRQLALRVGTADQRAAREPADRGHGRRAPVSAALPVTVGLDPAPVLICGAEGPRRLLLHYVLMQLDAAGVPVVLLGPPDGLPLSARFLPLTVLAGSPALACAAIEGVGGAAGARAVSGGGAGPGAPAAVPNCVLVSLGGKLDVPLARHPGLPSIHFAAAEADRGAGLPDVRLEATGGGFLARIGGTAFVPDGVPADVFDRYARARAGEGKRAPRLNPLGPCAVPFPGHGSPQGVAERWRAAAGAPLSPVPVGRSGSGDEVFSFAEDGPHLLVGGTTGSGKSEFLRTLAGSLAARHSPSDLQFILVDFKGGAGLAPLQKFPHTSTLITDLDGRGMDRLLASLLAEIHRREALLGQAGAGHINGYRARPGTAVGCGPMAHLVIIIDEFRVLVDQHPDAMNELMRIAAVGRSLGIHLVMATQRPQGAISADIRANVTSSVCLRVQATFDSQDVIASGVAASIGVDTPGRAYIRRAGSRPTEFQTATLRIPPARQRLPAVAEPAAGLLRRQAANGGERPAGAATAPADSDVVAVAGLLTEAWRLLAGPRGTEAPGDPAVQAHAALARWAKAPAVVAPELPRDVGLDPLAVPPDTRGAGPRDTAVARHAQDPGAGPEAVLLGLVDVPEHQSLEPLAWSPGLHSHVACIGTRAASSAAVGLLAAQVLAANAARSAPPPHYLYLLDGDGSLQGLSHSPWVGSQVTPSGLRTAARLLLRLSELAASSDSPMAVFASDWGRWVAAFRSSPWPWAEDCAAALVRHSRAAVAVVLGGDRELLTAPFMAAVPNRIFLPFGASGESRLMWPRMPRFTPVPGRAAIFGPLNAAAAGGAADEPHVAQLGQAGPGVPASVDGRAAAAGLPPLVVEDLPDTLSLAAARRALAATGQGGHATAGTTNPAAAGPRAPQALMVGLGGDGRTPVTVSMPPGSVLPVLGGPGSGKSTFLAAVRELNNAPDGILWVDDAALLPPGRLQALAREVAAGGSALVAVPNHLPSLARLPSEWGLRAAELGIVLRPRRQQDGELFGLRLDTAGAEPPGRAVLVDRGQMEWFQFPSSGSGRRGC